MTEAVFKDIDDGGQISLFFRGSYVLATCTKGHAWLLEANVVNLPVPSKAQNEQPQEPARHPIAASDVVFSKAFGPSGKSTQPFSSEALTVLVNQFGTEPLDAMNIDFQIDR